jgi:hypothetical protein
LVLSAYVCVCAFSLHRESPDMILGDEPLISEVVLSQYVCSNCAVASGAVIVGIDAGRC